MLNTRQYETYQVTCQSPFCGKSFHPHRKSMDRFCCAECSAEYRRATAKGYCPDIAAKIVSLTDELAPKMVFHGAIDAPMMTTADWHLPNLHTRCFGRMLSTAARLNIRTLAIVGDFMDMKYYATHKKIVPSDNDPLPPMNSAEECLALLLLRFDRIVLVPGNHDYWLIQAHNGNASFPAWCEAFFGAAMKSGKLFVYDLPYIFATDTNPDTGNVEQFALVHQRTFSGQNMGGVASDLEASRPEFRDHHVIVTHGHLDESRQSRPGHRQALSLPCMTDINRTDYPHRFPTRHRTWNVGFGFIKWGWHWTVPDIMPDGALDAIIGKRGRK